MSIELEDGLYRVVQGGMCAGFVVKDGKITWCAPILRKRLPSLIARAERVGD